MKRVIVLLSLLAAAGCGNLVELPTTPDAGEVDPTATFTRVQNEIFTPSCAHGGCHDAVGRQQGLVLAPGQSYAMLVNVPSSEVTSAVRVQPGDHVASYLYRKVTGGSIVGERMPLGGPYLSDAQMNLLRDWIRRGAPND